MEFKLNQLLLKQGGIGDIFKLVSSIPSTVKYGKITLKWIIFMIVCSLSALVLRLDYSLSLNLLENSISNNNLAVNLIGYIIIILSVFTIVQLVKSSVHNILYLVKYRKDLVDFCLGTRIKNEENWTKKVYKIGINVSVVFLYFIKSLFLVGISIIICNVMLNLPIIGFIYVLPIIASILYAIWIFNMHSSNFTVHNKGSLLLILLSIGYVSLIVFIYPMLLKNSMESLIDYFNILKHKYRTNINNSALIYLNDDEVTVVDEVATNGDNNTRDSEIAHRHRVNRVSNQLQSLSIINVSDDQLNNEQYESITRRPNSNSTSNHNANPSTSSNNLNNSSVSPESSSPRVSRYSRGIYSPNTIMGLKSGILADLSSLEGRVGRSLESQLGSLNLTHLSNIQQSNLNTDKDFNSFSPFKYNYHVYTRSPDISSYIPNTVVKKFLDNNWGQLGYSIKDYEFDPTKPYDYLYVVKNNRLLTNMFNSIPSWLDSTLGNIEDSIPYSVRTYSSHYKLDNEALTDYHQWTKNKLAYNSLNKYRIDSSNIKERSTVNTGFINLWGRSIDLSISDDTSPLINKNYNHLVFSKKYSSEADNFLFSVSTLLHSIPKNSDSSKFLGIISSHVHSYLKLQEVFNISNRSEDFVKFYKDLEEVLMQNVSYSRDGVDFKNYTLVNSDLIGALNLKTLSQDGPMELFKNYHYSSNNTAAYINLSSNVEPVPGSKQIHDYDSNRFNFGIQYSPFDLIFWMDMFNTRVAVERIHPYYLDEDFNRIRNLKSSSGVTKAVLELWKMNKFSADTDINTFDYHRESVFKYLGFDTKFLNEHPEIFKEDKFYPPMLIEARVQPTIYSNTNIGLMDEIDSINSSEIRSSGSIYLDPSRSDYGASIDNSNRSNDGHIPTANSPTPTPSVYMLGPEPQIVEDERVHLSRVTHGSSNASNLHYSNLNNLNLSNVDEASVINPTPSITPDNSMNGDNNNNIEEEKIIYKNEKNSVLGKIKNILKLKPSTLFINNTNNSNSIEMIQNESFSAGVDTSSQYSGGLSRHIKNNPSIRAVFRGK